MKLGLGEANIRLIEVQPQPLTCARDQFHKPNVLSLPTAVRPKEDTYKIFSYCNTTGSNCPDGSDSSACISGILEKSSPNNAGAKKTMSRRNAWGCLSYADLIAQAIESVPEKRLTLSQIYDWMVKNVPYFHDKAKSTNSAGWKNSIRHNLSLHRRFMRVQNEGSGKSSWWVINESSTSTRRYRHRVATNGQEPSEKRRARMRKKNAVGDFDNGQSANIRHFTTDETMGPPAYHSVSPYLLMGGGDANRGNAACEQTCRTQGIYFSDNRMSMNQYCHESGSLSDGIDQPANSSCSYENSMSVFNGFDGSTTSKSSCQKTIRLPPASVLLSPTSSQRQSLQFSSDNTLQRVKTIRVNSAGALSETTSSGCTREESNEEDTSNLLLGGILYNARNQLIEDNNSFCCSDLLRQSLSQDGTNNTAMASGDTNMYSYNTVFSPVPTLDDPYFIAHSDATEILEKASQGILRSFSDCGYGTGGNGSEVTKMEICASNSLVLPTTERNYAQNSSAPVLFYKNPKHTNDPTAVAPYCGTSSNIDSTSYCPDMNSYESEVTVATSIGDGEENVMRKAADDANRL